MRVNLATIPNLTEHVSMRSVNLAEGDPSQWVQDTRTGLIIPHDHVPARRPIAVDLFCGCGGFSLGIIQGGFEVVAACDNDEWATLTYMVNLGTYPIDIHFLGGEPDKERLNKAVETQIDLDNGTIDPETMRRRKPNRKGEPPKVLTSMPFSGKHRPPDRPGVGHFYFGDVRKLSGKQILSDLHLHRGDIDLVFGGPPCQGFSQAGRRDVMDPRNSLVFEFTRLVCELMPKTMVIENVPAMASMVTPEGMNVVDAICVALSDGGYSTVDALRRSFGVTKDMRAAARNTREGKKTVSKMQRHSQPREDPIAAAVAAEMLVQNPLF